MTQVKTLDFTGQSIYCGIDVHKKSWSVCLRNQDRELRTFSQNADPDALISLLKRHYPQAQFEVAYEAGFCGFWAQQRFKAAGLTCHIVHPGDVPQANRDRRYKTDTVDCRKLALELSKGALNCIHVPHQQTLESRSLIRTRGQLVKDQTRYKNRILSFLDFFGLQVPPNYKNSTHFSQRFIQWLMELPLSASSTMALQTKLTVLSFIRQQLLQLTRQLRALAHSEPYCQATSLLTSIPGIGLHSALIIALEIEDIRRFPHFDQLASLAGFKPDVYSSAERHLVKGVTHHCNHLLRETLVECAWMAVGKDPALTQAYAAYKKRMHYNKAILRIAKKLLNRVRYVLLHQKPYLVGKIG